MVARTPSRSRAPRHRTPSLDVERVVVDAALRIIAADGAESMTVRRLASEADVAAMSIYNRFGDMHGVFDAVFTHGFTEFTDALQSECPTPDPVGDLHRMGRSYRRFALANPDLYAFMFLRVVPGLEPSEDSMLAAARSFDVLHTAVIRSLDAGRFRPADPSVVAQEIWSTCHGAVALELLGMAEFADPASTYEALLLTLLRGLLTDPDSVATLG